MSHLQRGTGGNILSDLDPLDLPLKLGFDYGQYYFYFINSLLPFIVCALGYFCFVLFLCSSCAVNRESTKTNIHEVSNNF